jgi:hypothetical protein
VRSDRRIGKHAILAAKNAKGAKKSEGKILRDLRAFVVNIQGPGQMDWSSFVAAREAALADGKPIRLSVKKQEKEKET